MLNYYTLNKNSGSKDFYYNNEGIFNLDNEYLVIHINGHHIIAVNNLGREFHGSITNEELALAKDKIKNEFCGVKGCSASNRSVGCEIIRDWGEDVCKRIWEWVNE